MISKPTNAPPAVPSRNALRVLRRLALAGSTVGSFCTVAAITYDVHRRVRVAERIVENKRALQTSAPNYDATSAAKRLARMMEAAEAGEFMGLASLKEADRKIHLGQSTQDEDERLLQGERSHGPSVGIAESETLVQAESFLEAARTKLVDALTSQSEVGRLPGQSGCVPPDQIHVAEGLRRAENAIGRGTSRSDVTINKDIAVEGAQLQSDVPRQMQELLDRGRPIEAAQLFLGAHSGALNGISKDRKEMALKVFFVNCKEDNVFIARSIFERIEEVDEVSLVMWKTLMLALAKKGCIESVATIYTRYMHQFACPPEMVDVVLRCLLESHRLTTAKWFLLRHLQHDRDCGLCGAYLSGLWRKTRSIELINGQLKKILTVLPRFEKLPSDKLFNPVIKAYVEFGRVADAEALVHDMTTIYDLPLRCRTKGLLVYAKALSLDWEGVEVGLEEMHKLRLTRRRRDFLPIFDRIFLEYWVSHSGPQIRNFVFRYLDEFNIIPDKVLYKHILEAFVEKGDKDMIAELTSMAKQRSWNIPINEQEFMEILRSRRLALEEAPVGFWQMLQAARVKYGQSSTSQRILGYDQQSFPIAEVNNMPYTQSPSSWYQRTLQETTPSRPVDQYQKLHKQMTHYMHVGKMADALKCFQNAKNARYQMRQLHVELAVIATLLEHGLDAARSLVETEWRGIRHLVRFFPIFFRQVMSLDPDATGEMIQIAVLRFYQICSSTKNMTVKHHITVGTSRRLISQREPKMAQDLLAAVYMSRYRHVVPFDGVYMKMFARTFAATKNIPGLRWCILTALSRESALNHDFVVEIRRILGTLSPSGPGSVPSEQMEYLLYIADLLEEKSEGCSPLWEIKHDPTLKASSRQQLKRPLDTRLLFNQSDVREAVKGWDEEYELEAVLGNIDTDPRSVASRWTEQRCLSHKTGC
ncbi:pentatricopeptide repeat protein [Aspergillus clavatus NRRL 1]|uniref:Pentatricopeptide repeat protein n=1 Tax=Aspergillus clavatus (strain ATCC 1007 / CBS 513.65 / DSM 816 / NCTC 3887 / NRRL 1 / QM 1276 / 107) TaxID=344612 RepID=A1CAS8_ASPCL|nr:pentatricopeptide repeat protein [Aspergillus clavatus NRRL 1]EAW12846.1 pentatricopeptide repeat protein [Aspergillus clavatus NRRL 1]